MTKIRRLAISILILTTSSIASCDNGIEPPLSTPPVLTTSAVTNVDSSSAVCGGQITSDGGAAITARGVCWGPRSNPTIVDNRTLDGNGAGSFSSHMTGLDANATYSVRAYATNSAGTGYGGNTAFTTAATSGDVPALSTVEPSGVTSSSVLTGGHIASNGGTGIIEKGVCWSKDPGPTTADNKRASGSTEDRFISWITGLEANQTYYVRSYARNGSGVGYGEVLAWATLPVDPLEYFGQTPPGGQLIPFAHHIIGNWQHGEVTASPDGKEIYWTNDRSILFSKIENGRWTAPAVAPFSGQGNPQGSVPYDDNPVVSPDNKKLFFTSLRAIGYASPNRENIWYVERTPAGWGEPQPLPQNVNSMPYLHWQISVTMDGTVYFGANFKIFFTRPVDGTYSNPEEVPVANGFGDVMQPFIAPDESYLIFSRVVDGRPSSYISFKDKSGPWLPPQPLSQVRGTCFVTRDGKFIFSCFHWMSAKFIEDLRPR